MVGDIDSEDACDDNDDDDDDDAVDQQLFPAGVLFPVPGEGVQSYCWGTLCRRRLMFASGWPSWCL